MVLCGYVCFCIDIYRYVLSCITMFNYALLCMAIMAMYTYEYI